MTFLIGPMRKHIDGHKELTETNPIIDYSSKVVAVAVGVGAHEGALKVAVGDEVKIGTLLAAREDHFYVPFYSPVSGKVVGIEKRMSARLKPVNHVIIENDMKDECDPIGTLDLSADKAQIIDFMKKMGLLGQGGAGFPSYIKYNTDKCEALLINAVECEPYITADVKNIEEHMDDFKYGVKLMFKASGAKVCKIGIKVTHKELILKLKKAFAGEKQFVVCPVPNVYPMGWERTLTFELLKKRYEKLPIEAGAIVSNATSAISLGMTARTGLPTYERIVTVSGNNVKNPSNVRCRIGTTVGELLELCGGLVSEPANILMGGPMMGSCVTKPEVSITQINNAVSLFKHTVEDAVACLRCGRCVEHCPSSLQPVQIRDAAKANAVERLGKLNIMDCVECGMCSYICPSKIDITEDIRKAKRLYALKGKK